MKNGIFANYASRLPIGLSEHAISLGEGATPLLKLNNLPTLEKIDIQLWVKVEGANPTGSFKDRGMVVAIAAACQQKAVAVICASTGNTSASAAAYAARANLACHVLLPTAKVATGKLAQAIILGANIIAIDGNFDDAMQLVRKFDSEKFAVVNSINPYRIQGQKTIAFEVIEALGEAPDVHALPVGNAGNITAHWIGYSEASANPTQACEWCGGNCELAKEKLTNSRPKMLGVQAVGAAPFVQGAMVDNPETVATAIRIGHPQSWDAAHVALKESGGKIIAMADEELLRIQAVLASSEGVFCEPASAAGVAGVIAEAKAGNIKPGSKVVCTLTGNGLKDTSVVNLTQEFEPIQANQQAIAKLIGLA